MSEIRLAYRATDPVSAATEVAAAAEAKEVARKAILAFGEEFFPGATVRANHGWDGSLHPTGFARGDATGDVPEGLRRGNRRGEFVPAKSTEAGKALAKRFDDLTFTNPRVAGLGGIATGDVGESGYLFGWRFHPLTRLDGSVEVYATAPVDTVDDRSALEVLNSGAWEKVRLSAFHAAREEHEESTAADPAEATA